MEDGKMNPKLSRLWLLTLFAFVVAAWFATLAIFAADVPAEDAAFSKDAAVASLAEIELGKLAAAKGADPEVKDFGRQMQTDHGKANDELKGIAKTEGIALPAGLDAEHRALYDRLSKLSGAEFDREYVKAMVDGHTKVAAKFEREADQGQDARLRDFARKTLPVTQQHLAMAKSLAAKVGA
jgi:putative membrane protein